MFCRAPIFPDATFLLYKQNSRESQKFFFYTSKTLDNRQKSELVALEQQLLRNGVRYFLFDEPQNIDHWDEAISALYAERDHQTLYLQVASSTSERATSERKFGAFQGIDDNWPKYILTLDDPSIPEAHDGIERRYLPEFILHEL